MITFAHLFFYICILAMLFGAVILMPLGSYMLSLSCLFAYLAGCLLFTAGLALFISLLRLFLKSIHRH